MQDSPFANVSDEKPQRPVVITVFAIFTLIGCAFTLISLFIPMDLFTRNLDNPPPSPPQWIAYAGGALAMVKLLGALQLLQMKRLGFFLYAGGEAAAAVLSIISTRIMMDLMANFPQAGPVDTGLILIISAGFGLLLSILFIAVYGSQLSKMT